MALERYGNNHNLEIWMMIPWNFVFQVSKLMLLPNLAYSWTFNCSISARIVLILVWTSDTDRSMLSVELDSIS